MTLDEFFAGRLVSRQLFDAVAQVIAGLGPVEVRVSKSQVAFRRRKSFAFAWIPGMYLARNDVPLVLSIGLSRQDASPRWKQVVEPTPGHYIHHLELRSREEVDAQVAGWLHEAWIGS
jgi:hypothetical protein